MPTPDLSLLIYCRDDPVSARWVGIDALLSEFQCDQNVYSLATGVQWLLDNYQTTVSLASVSQPTPSQLLFTLTDATTFGPFDIPVSTFRDRGDWAVDTPYLINDTFNAPNGGLYRVIYDHTSDPASFDPAANDGMGHDFYAAMIPPRGNTIPAGGAIGMYFRKNSAVDYVANWAFIRASEIVFAPSSSSALTSDNAADAIEEVEALIPSSLDSTAITYTPTAWLTSTNVADALGELANINALNVAFTPTTDSALTSDNIADALIELEISLAGSVAGFLPLAGGTMAGAIELAADPASALQPATKQYVDGLALNLGKRSRVRAATTANITIATALNNADTLDGVTLATGDLVLVKNQSAPAENGVYVVGVSPARFAEFDSYDEHPGSLIAVEEGSTNADTLWLCTSNAGGTLNSTAIAFSAATVSGALVAANNLSDLTNAASARSNIGLATGSIEIVIDGGGSTITTGIKGDIYLPIGGTITEVTMAADQSGSIVVDVWKCTYAQFDDATHPVSGDKITASAPPTITTATKSKDSTLTGWTTAFSADDILRFNVNSVTTIQRVTLSLKYTK